MAGVDLTMGMAAPLFLAMWVAMMAAMMLPSAAPMIIAFARSQARKRQEGGPFVPTWLFVAPYGVVWLVFGIAGYLAAFAFGAVAGSSPWMTQDVPRLAGGLIVAAGAYQLTPLKRVCLARCRSPLSFMLSYWRSGRWGAVTMGLRHGLLCVGCCWLLFVVLFPLGIMNVAAMVAVTVLIFAEKVLPIGDRVAGWAAAVLIVYGLVAVAVPDVLPIAI